MRLYFIKATYTDGIYKLEDFFVGTQYKQDVNKMQNIDLKANDGYTTTTVNTILPDGTRVNDHSHVIVPEVNKIYEIDRCVYVNNQQTQIQLVEDVLIGNYQEVKDKKIRIERSNDETLFNGIHDIEDITVRPNLTTLGTGITLTGQWVVYFIDASSIKRDVEYTIYKDEITSGEANISYFDTGLSIEELKIKYPEIETDDPLSVNYFNKKVSAYNEQSDYVSIYYKGRIVWVRNQLYLEGQGEGTGSNITISGSNLSSNLISLAPDLSMVALAFPIERGIGVNGGTVLMSYSSRVASGIRSNDWKILGIGIYSESQIFENSTVEYNDNWIMNNYFSPSKVIKYDKSLLNSNILKTTPQALKDNFDNTGEVNVLQLVTMNSDIKLNIPTTNSIYDYEPFKKYTVSVYGKEYVVSKKNLETLRIRSAPTMGMIEYFGYINNDLSQKLFSDSYTVNIKWSVDELVLFNQENPTYKDQFNSNMWRKGTNIITGVAKGAIGGALVGNIPGAVVGATTGLITGTMNMGFDGHSEKLREKGLELKPDQIFGDGSSVSLTGQSKYGIYVNTTISDFEDSMKIKYELTGFPTTKIRTIEELNQGNTTQFGKTKLVKGQLLETVRNKYTTNEINRRLQEGVILI